ncbi:Gfo/Idh/MocA family protein [Tropicimonas sp. S265A]|uniref:Gfo/Idh/MocA family protein n=1 Tax=Tropicimonas sp. S265A TaxID=3415134 RepID=UPI003C7E7617
MTLRVACLGAGYFAQFHHDAWRRIDGAELSAVADRNPGLAARSGAAAYADLGVMLRVQEPDVLDIVTPPSTHADAIREALTAGVRAIICQKPFCETLQEARAVAAEADAADVPLIIHENFRFQPWYRAMRTAIEAGSVGDVRQFTFRMRTGDGRGPEAYLARQPYFQKMPRFLVHETGVHWVDTFRYLLGEASGVYADLRRENPAIAGEDAGYILFDYANGSRALFDANRTLDHATQDARLTFGEALLEGTEATLALRGDGSVTTRAFGATAEKTLLPAASYSGFAGDCVYALQNHVVRAMAGDGSFENLASDYMVVREIEEAVYASAEARARMVLS